MSCGPGLTELSLATVRLFYFFESSYGTILLQSPLLKLQWMRQFFAPKPQTLIQTTDINQELASKKSIAYARIQSSHVVKSLNFELFLTEVSDFYQVYFWGSISWANYHYIVCLGIFVLFNWFGRIHIIKTSIQCSCGASLVRLGPNNNCYLHVYKVSPNIWYRHPKH